MVDLTYQQHVQPEGLPGRYFPRLPGEMPAADFGGEIGRGIEYAGEEAQQHANRAMDQARQTQLTDAHNQFQTLSSGLMRDPQTGALTKQGKDAFGIGAENSLYLSQYDQQSAKILAGVTDPRARLAAQEAAAQVRGHLKEQLDSHEISQRQRFDQGTAEDSIELAIQAAAQNYNHPDILAMNRDHIEVSLDNLAKQQGWSAEERQLKGTQALNRMHDEVVMSMLSQNDVRAAQGYVVAHLLEMDPRTGEAVQRAVLVKQEHDLVMGEKYQKLASDQLAKRGDDLLRKGQLTPQWLEQNRKTLEPNEYRYFTRAVSGMSDAPRDPATYMELRERSSRGMDVRDDARRAVQSGQLDLQQYDRLTSDVERERPGAYSRGKQYLSEFLKPSQQSFDPFPNQRQAEALDAWQDWADKHPDATEPQMRDAYKDIGDHFAFIQQNAIVAGERPKFLVGDRSEPDLDATERDTVKAYREKRITRDEAERQAQIIKQWRDAVSKTQPKKSQ